MANFRALTMTLAALAVAGSEARLSASDSGSPKVIRVGGVSVRDVPSSFSASSASSSPSSSSASASPASVTKVLTKGSKGTKGGKGATGALAVERTITQWLTFTSETDSTKCAITNGRFSDMAACRTNIDLTKARHMAQTANQTLAANGILKCAWGVLAPNVFKDGMTHDGYFTDFGGDHSMQLGFGSCKKPKVYAYATSETTCAAKLDAKKKVWLLNELEPKGDLPFVPIDRASLALVSDCKDLSVSNLMTAPWYAKGLNKIPKGTKYSTSAAASAVGAVAVTATLALSSLFI